MRYQLQVNVERWPLRQAFTIARGSKIEAEVIVVQISDGTYTGCGECVPYKRYSEDIVSVHAQIESVRAEVENGLDVEGLQTLLPAGAARNALDCALWDLRCKQQQCSIYQLLDIASVVSIPIMQTLSLDTPQAMARAAAQHPPGSMLKIKLGQGVNLDIERLAAIHAATPDTRWVLDVNEGWTLEELSNLLPELKRYPVVFLEQPVHRDNEQALAHYQGAIKFCADESFHDRSSLSDMQGLYQVVNIKLDKTGGLTEALATIKAAKSAGLEIMLGCMVCTSLGILPALLFAGMADFVDLDGAMFLATDRENGIEYVNSLINSPLYPLWGL